MKFFYALIFFFLVIRVKTYPTFPEELGKKKTIRNFIRYGFLGGDYQGDILLTTDQLQRGVGKRNPLARWPNGIIPYEISNEYGRIE